MAYINAGPSAQVTTNTQSPYAEVAFIQTIAVSLTPAAVGTISAPEQSFGLNGVTQATLYTGIKAGDVIIDVSPPSTTPGVTIGATRIDPLVPDRFYIQFVNPTAGSLTPPAGVYYLTVLRFNSSNSSPNIPTSLQ